MEYIYIKFVNVFVLQTSNCTHSIVSACVCPEGYVLKSDTEQVCVKEECKYSTLIRG